MVAGSASEFIHRITTWARLNGCTQVLLPPHSYGDYAQAAQAHGLAVLRRSAKAAVGGEGSDATTPATLHWACEPASPLGTVDGVLSAWHGPTPPGSVRVLDCAYRPLRLATSHSDPELPASAWQLWSPNKSLGLTGVRAAYAVAPAGAEGTVLALQGLAASWPVGAHGVALLEAWATPAVQQWVAACLPTLRSWKDRQMALCTQLGWSVVSGSLANYFVATLPAAQCTDDSSAQTASLLAALRQHGIKLRDCTSFGLPGAVRLGVLQPASQDALQTVWQAVQAGCTAAEPLE